ncbi:GSCFA domain-containing protein [Aliiroseovarius sp. M344]|uniref:GSCFA domain-containing protein n=1 Tax=Aliiroseovarius sp. M344 TaxID=2867010 RepID=UPI0021AE1AB3|nr:GSCFA domain-containing protein [Aliiroseovarius sp. M344]UWQ14579.1 GSCFA domain-containing protein [Aliiroseovarius sp. M344]
MTKVEKDLAPIYVVSSDDQKPEPHITSYDKIRENRRQNKYNRWIDTGNDERAAQQRFKEDFFFVGSLPKFKLKRTDKFFGIGSCFARNIERELSAQGMTCLTEGTNIPQEFYVGDRDARSAMNKFNIPSMIDEVERTFNPKHKEPGRYIEVGQDEYFDPATSGVKLLPLDQHAIVRESVKKTTLRLAEADCVIITLGLVEAWFDRASGLYLNTSPHPRAMQAEIRREKKGWIRKKPNRFVHMRPNFAFLRDKMHHLIKTISTHAPNAKIVISVSPVPLQATMTSDDVVASSTLSKSLLRVVAEDARDSFDHVDYFPSYEMVMSSPREHTWEDDEIHVKSDLVGQITRSFVDLWIE